jgi:bacterioferritin (cytochrome b1)
MDELATKNREKVIDLLTERLAFERSGVKLYDAIIRKMEQSPEPAISEMLDQMREHRADEKGLEEQIRSLGGDAHAETELSRLVTRESVGIEDVVEHDPELPHLFHALLAAELVDNAGWDLLAAIADEANDKDARKAFKKRLHEEEEHLVFCRRAVEKLTEHAVFETPVSMPVGP